MPRKPKKQYATDKSKFGIKDFCQTPSYAIDPLLPFLALNNVRRVWEPAAGKGRIVSYFRNRGYEVLADDILYGEEQDFFSQRHIPNVDVVITNVPFGAKYEWIKRLYEIELPFAIIVPVDTIAANGIHEALFGKNKRSPRFELGLFSNRINFDMPYGGFEGSAQMPTMWLCHGVLPARMLLMDIKGKAAPRLEDVQFEPIVEYKEALASGRVQQIMDEARRADEARRSKKNGTPLPVEEAPTLLPMEAFLLNGVSV